MKTFQLFLGDFIVLHEQCYTLPSVQNFLYLTDYDPVAFEDAMSAILYEFANDPAYEITREVAHNYLMATRNSVNGGLGYTIYKQKGTQTI